MPLSPRTFWALALLALALIAAPVWTFSELPIVDYPAHLVRVTLLSNLPLDPILARYWTVHLRPVANLGMDVFVPAVAPLTARPFEMRPQRLAEPGRQIPNLVRR